MKNFIELELKDNKGKVLVEADTIKKVTLSEQHAVVEFDNQQSIVATPETYESLTSTLIVLNIRKAR